MALTKSTGIDRIEITRAESEDGEPIVDVIVREATVIKDGDTTVTTNYHRRVIGRKDALAKDEDAWVAGVVRAARRNVD